MRKTIPPHQSADGTKRPAILVVDDDPEILAAAQAALTANGYATYLSDAANPQILTDVLHGAFQPALILLDILLSGKDGREICRELKTNPTTKNIPIIMFSAYPHAAVGATDAGADDFLAKPFGLKELLNVVAKFVSPPKNQ